MYMHWQGSRCTHGGLWGKRSFQSKCLCCSPYKALIVPRLSWEIDGGGHSLVLLEGLLGILSLSRLPFQSPTVFLLALLISPSHSALLQLLSPYGVVSPEGSQPYTTLHPPSAFAGSGA